MPKIDLDYRANVARSISVYGEIKESLVSTLSTQILKHRTEGNAPITVFINSPGGTLQSLDYIYGLLTVKGTAVRRPRIITVAVGTAASAAAILLSLGDYAICYPTSYIHFHGSRYGKAEDVTMESAYSMASQLDAKNKAIAQLLAESGATRLAFHYARLKDKFKTMANDRNGWSDIECFANCLEEQLSPKVGTIVRQAQTRWKYLSGLYDKIVSPCVQSGKKGVEFEAEILTRIIAHDIEIHKSECWPLDESGIFEVVGDYLLLRDYDMGKHSELIRKIVNTYPKAFFTETEAKQVMGTNEIEVSDDVKTMIVTRMQNAIRPFCYFAATVWQALQHDENPLTPTDAYWLGAIDEVYDSGLPCAREVAESEPEQTNLEFSNEQAQLSAQSPSSALPTSNPP